MWLPTSASRAPPSIRLRRHSSKAGLSGLLPKHRGPKQGHKLSCRGHRVCADLASRRPWVNDRRLRPSHSGNVRDHGSSPQPGAGVGEQKKTAQSGVRSPIPAGTVEAYEGLRQQVVQPDGRGMACLEGRGVLMRCGLADLGPDQALDCASTSIRIVISYRRSNRRSSTRLEPNSSGW